MTTIHLTIDTDTAHCGDCQFQDLEGTEWRCRIFDEVIPRDDERCQPCLDAEVKEKRQ